MIVEHSFDDTTTLNNSVIAFGNFDGIHLGHKAIIKKVTDISKKLNIKSVIITFSPHTKQVVDQDENFKTLTDFDFKKKIISTLGVDVICKIKFNKEYAAYSHEMFLDALIEKYNPIYIVLGYDNKFGKNRSGEYSILKNISKYKHIKFIKVEQLFILDKTIKTTVIKDFIKSGDIDNANNLLGYKYKIIGTVIEGKNKGKEIGFPTANLDLTKIKQLIPKNGVYSVNLIFDSCNYKAICNIGTRPTLYDKGDKSFEIHILDYNINLYNKVVVIEFNYFIRKEKKFNNVSELSQQINDDIHSIRNKE